MNETGRGLAGLAPRRKAAGYIQETFAVDLGVSRSLLAAWEVGRAWPSAKRLPDMAALLGCSMEELYTPPPTEEADTEDTEGGEAGAERGPEHLL